MHSDTLPRKQQLIKLADQAMTVVRVLRAPSSSFPFLCFLLLAPLCRTSDAQGSAMIEAFRCSASGNYTPGDAYAANLDKFLAALPENAVSRNGGFFSGTVGEGAATVYGLAMCSADYSRADCGGCLAAVAGGNTGGLPTRCPGSATVHAVFDRCLVRYSDSNFLGSAEIDIIYTSGGAAPSSASTYSAKMKNVLQLLTDEAVASPQRFAANMTSPPFALVQCTWDLPPDKCKQCLEMLSANASDWWTMTIEGKRKSYSCSVRYSNTSFVVVPFSGASGSTASVGQKGPPAHDSHPVAMVIGTVIAVVVVAFLICLVCNVRRLRRQQKRQVYAIKSFTYKQLAQATNNFAEDVKLGQGSFGAVYEGSGLPGIKENVAIKKILDTSADHTKRDFDNEISIMSQLHHRNILRLMGWCKEDKHLLLIYEIMKKGNLEDHLYPQIGASDSQVYGVMVDDTCSQLGWPRRRNVLIGIASGLAYLHTECPKSIVHRDIKPGNVMLDMDFNAKLSDFGLVTQVNHTQTSRATVNIIGTRTYIDPAYIETGKTCGQSDVYSLGVMLLEIVCGEKPAIQTDDKNSLIEKVLKCQANNTILCAADKGLRGQFDGELKSVLEIGLMCVSPDRHRRPHIGRVRDLLMQLLPSNPTIPSGANGRGSTSSNTYPMHSPADEEAGDSPLLV